MQRQVPAYLAIFLAVIICGPAVWADENPKAAKTGKEVQRQAHEPLLADQTPEVAKTGPSDVKRDESAPDAAGGDVTVSWQGGRLFFPDTSGKASGLRLRCTGNVMIKGKGVTAKTTDLDVTIERKGVIRAASSLSLECAGSVTIEWKGFTAMAPALKYDAEKEVLALSSAGNPRGCILASKNKDGTHAVLIADQISLSPASNRVSCLGVREYRAADSSTQPIHPAYGTPPSTPGMPCAPGIFPGPGVSYAPGYGSTIPGSPAPGPSTYYPPPAVPAPGPSAYPSPAAPTPGPSTYAPGPAPTSPSPSLPGR